MKKLAKIAVAATVLVAAMSAQAEVIYTGELGKSVKGYRGPTPVNITIENGKIVSIEAEANQESPNYLKRAEAKVFPQYVGKSVSEALSLKADAATGATYSSKALIENIRLGLEQAAKQSTAKASKKTAKTTKRSSKSSKRSSKKKTRRSTK